MSVSSKLHDHTTKCIIAIDGTSASGKGTLASLIAKRFSLVHFQSSILYRHLALRAIQHNVVHNKQEVIALSKSCEDAIDLPELYSENVTESASVVAAIPEVRQNLYHMLQDFLQRHLRVVMDGRDIGTVIAPHADIKIYVTAKLEVRAKRRYNQLLAESKNVSEADILQKLNERDRRDMERKSAPLAIADDAILLDTTNISPEEAIETLLKMIG